MMPVYMRGTDFMRDSGERISQSQVYATFKYVENKKPALTEPSGIIGKAKNFLGKIFSHLLKRGGNI